IGLMNEYLSNDNRVKPNFVIIKNIIISFIISYGAKSILLAYKEEEENSNGNLQKKEDITFDDYTRCLNEEIEMTLRQSCIRSKLHEIYTISESKIALNPYDDKRYVVSDSTETFPWGY
ncbi:hypothetical protein ALC56_03939, partial [Trachymyrmex septentrionalis]